MTAAKQRKLVYYSGRVQGVGFRYTTLGIAKRFDVTGFVRNLPDGRVELIVEGQDCEISAFLGEIAREFDRNVTDRQVKNGVSTNEFSGFEIRH